MRYLTAINTFSHLFPEKYFLLFVIPPFHLEVVIALIISDYLWWNYGWNMGGITRSSTHIPPIIPPYLTC